MDIVIIIIVALLVSGLTFFSGFGLGTLLLPAFALFFPIEAAVAATAIVHLANNVFKITLVGKYAVLRIVLLFGIPAALFAALGAWLLNYMSDLPPVTSYTLFGYEFSVEIIKLVIALLMLVFAWFELQPSLKNINIKEKLIPIGGVLSGFFGGLSGHQGALRTAFLIRAGMEKKNFIGTIAACSIIVDVTRVIVYGTTFFGKHIETMQAEGSFALIIAGTISAFAGTVAGKYLLDKVTMKGIRSLVAIMLIVLAIGIGAGII